MTRRKKAERERKQKFISQFQLLAFRVRNRVLIPVIPAPHAYIIRIRLIGHIYIVYLIETHVGIPDDHY